MHSRLSATSSNSALTSDTAARNETTIQHGDGHDFSSDSSLSGDEGGGVDVQSSALTAADQAPDSGSPPSHPILRGLSPPNGSSPVVRNRITEYENATSTSPRRRHEGPAFEVVKSTRQPGDKRSPIADLPNGTLTACYGFRVLLISSRDSDTCSRASLPYRSVFNRSRVAPFP